MVDGQHSANPLTETARIKSVKLSSAELAKLLDRLDQAADVTTAELAVRRAHSRRTYRVKGAAVIVTQGGVTASFGAPTRNISEGGLAFIHRNMLHVGTPCAAVLLTKDGTWRTVSAVVVRCRHLEGMLHEVGIKFGEEIDLSDIVEA